MSSNVSPAPLELLDKFRQTGSATVSAALSRLGYRLVVMEGVHPVRPGAKLVGRAVTLRYLPRREDHAVTKETRKTYAQYVATESVGPGDVLVVEARGNVRAGVFGDLYVSRMKARGAAGVVTDGAFRDTPFLRTLDDFHCFATGAHGLPSPTQHWASDVNIPVACGNVMVEPGDIVVGDDDGVVVVPRKVAEEVADNCLKTEAKEAFLRTLVEAGEAAQSYDADPFTPELEKRFAEWKTKARIA